MYGRWCKPQTMKKMLEELNRLKKLTFNDNVRIKRLACEKALMNFKSYRKKCEKEWIEVV
jgi:hypothetical protein